MRIKGAAAGSQQGIRVPPGPLKCSVKETVRNQKESPAGSGPADPVWPSVSRAAPLRLSVRTEHLHPLHPVENPRFVYAYQDFSLHYLESL